MKKLCLAVILFPAACFAQGIGQQPAGLGPSGSSGGGSSYVLPVATTTVLGGIKPDGQTLVCSAGGVCSTTAANVTKTANYQIAAGDMGGQVNFNGTSLTVTIPAISSTVLAAGMSMALVNFNSSALTISTTPSLNGFSGTKIPQYGGIACVSNGTSLDCVGLGVLSQQILSGVTGQAFTGGLHPTAYSNGTASSGTTTIDCGNGPIQTLTNGGAFTFAMSANDGQCTVRVTNNGSAGAITFSGFSEGTNAGDSLTTTNTNKFDITLSRIGGNPHYLVSALQ